MTNSLVPTNPEPPPGQVLIYQDGALNLQVRLDTRFRQWATAQLREMLVKGFVLDDERIKSGRTLGQDYFDELLVRRSERMYMRDWTKTRRIPAIQRARHLDRQEKIPTYLDVEWKIIQ